MHAPSLSYTAVGQGACADEIFQIAQLYASLTVHLIDTTIDGRLTTVQVMAAAGTAGPQGLSAFMCGPAGMLGAFQTGLRLAGVPGRRIHREYSTGAKPTDPARNTRN